MKNGIEKYKMIVILLPSNTLTMTVDRKNLPKGIEFTTEQYERGGINGAELGAQRDKFLRHSIAVKRGLSPDATWDDINRQAAEITRKLTAGKLGMNIDASWNEIVAEEQKRR